MSAAEWSDGAAGPLLTLFDELSGPGLKWLDSALCAEVDSAIFFPEKGGSTKEAKQVCRLCDVRPACLAYITDIEANAGIRHGIWAGLTPTERATLRSERRAA
jgi:WhiB family redox-sensing transcriptional regulator